VIGICLRHVPQKVARSIVTRQEPSSEKDFALTMKDDPIVVAI
jgi:hypothetical protein